MIEPNVEDRQGPLGRIPFRFRLADTLATMLITVGGIGTILALLLVVMVLLANSLPLAKKTSLGSWSTLNMPYFRHAVVDEQGTVLWGLTGEGDIEVHGLQDNQRIALHNPVFEEDTEVTCSALSIDQRYLAFGLSNGEVLTAKIEFSDRLVPKAELELGAELSLKPDQDFCIEDAVYRSFDDNTFRQTRLLDPLWSTPKRVSNQPIQLIDYITEEAFEQLHDEKYYNFAMLSNQELILRRGLGARYDDYRCTLRNRSRLGLPVGIVLLDGADQILVVWEQGIVDRYELRAEELRLVESRVAFLEDDKIRCVAPVMGRQSMACGTESGQVLSWTLSTRETSDEDDLGALASPFQLNLAHQFSVGDTALRNISSSNRAHVLVTMDDSHRVSLCHLTTERVLTRSRPHVIEGHESLPPGSLQSSFAILNSKQRVAMAASFNQVSIAPVEVAFPQASLAGYLRPQWYESQAGPSLEWQPAASQSSEVKLSFIPLFYGTLKTALYALVFGLPVGLAAAVYCSEFASPTLRSRVKPTIELIGSFPSVVVGFVAATVAASILREHLLVLLLWITLFPVCIAAIAVVFEKQLPRFSPMRFPTVLSSVPLTMLLAWFLRGLLEPIFFSGNLVNWIGLTPDGSLAGWMLLCAPISELLLLLVFRQLWNRPIRLLSLLCLGLVAAIFVSWGLSSMGWDIRNSLPQGYHDQNALLLGIGLGFCILPTIFTMSDDALHAVPDSLRQASLACGASPWQTARNVILPAAGSGIISGVLIAFARAAGETMLVLTAVVNTPLMDWSPFSGLKALTSALVTELPDASVGEAQFHSLFVAALLLFVFTLALNSFAEFIKVRYRRRIAAL